MNVTSTAARLCAQVFLILTILVSLPIAAETMEDAMNAARMRDYTSMAAILKTLANEGDKDAQYQLAKLYRNGLGVDKDLKKSAYWAGKSADQGVTGAAKLRDDLCQKMTDCDNSTNRSQASSDQDQQLSPDVASEQLRNATRRNDIGRVKTLIEAGVSVNAMDKFGRTPLIEAVNNKHRKIVKLLLKAGAKVNHSDTYGETALSIAVANGDKYLTKTLLKAGAKINTIDKRGGTVIYSAISQSDNELVTLLLNFRANVNLTDKQGLTPLDLATRKEDKKIITLLENAGAKRSKNVAAETHRAISDEEAQLFKGWPDLMIAAWLDQPERLDGFLAAGASIDETDSDGHTALSRAAWGGNTDIVKRLLNVGADMEHRDNTGRTPIIWTLASQPHPETAQLLLQKKVNLNVRDKDGKTALLFAIEQNQLAIIKHLLQAGASPNLADNENVTPLLRATTLNQPDTVKLLLAFDANINLRDKNKRDALWYAADAGEVSIVQQLLDAGANTVSYDIDGQRSIDRSIVNHCQECLEVIAGATSKNDLLHENKDGNSLLSIAAEMNNLNALNYLITKDLPLNSRNKQGNTALMQAAARGNNAVVKALLEAGADPLLRNFQKLNASDLAQKGGHTDTVSIISEFGISKDKLWKIITG